MQFYNKVKADPLNLPAALFAQAQRLKSDGFKKLGLPVPILPSIKQEFIENEIAGRVQKEISEVNALYGTF